MAARLRGNDGSYVAQSWGGSKENDRHGLEKPPWDGEMKSFLCTLPVKMPARDRGAIATEQSVQEQRPCLFRVCEGKDVYYFACD